MKKRKVIFICILFISFFLILLYNILTPFITDDFIYQGIVSKADNLGDLIIQEKEQYINWNGRSITHFILRCFLFCDNRILFKILNSLAFVILSLLIYLNVSTRKTYDLFIFLTIQILLWTNAVAFSQTILWETGSINYLWGTTIILGFVTLFRYLCNKNLMGYKSIVLGFLLFLFGIIAGWCNENTSGGGLLIVLGMLVWDYYNKKQIHLWSIGGVLGMVTGLAIMVLAPGNRARAMSQEEVYTGFFALISRGLKIISSFKNHFGILLSIFLFLFLINWFQNKDKKRCFEQLLFLFAGIATACVLIFTAEPMPRAYFGAGIFILIAVVQSISNYKEKYYEGIKIAVLTVCCMWFAFYYIENGANLVRIYRDYSTREKYIVTQKNNGVSDITIPILRDEFDSVYSDAISSDITQDSQYWINQAYANAYGFQSVSGIEWEKWE